MTEEFHKARSSLVVFGRFFDGDNPIVVNLEEVQALREFNHDGVLRGLLKGAIVVYGVPVVDADGGAWEWTDEQE